MREANYVVPNPYFRSSGKRSGIPGDVLPERIRLKGAYGEWLMVVPEDVPCMWSFRAPVGLEEARLLLFSWDGKGDPVPVGLADGVERSSESRKRRIDDVCPVTFNFGPSTKTALLRGERGRLTLDRDTGYDQWDGRTWRVEVPEGLSFWSYACVHWRDDGTPELVSDRTVFRRPYLGIGVDRDNPPRFLFLKGSRKDRSLSAVLGSEYREGEDGHWKIEVPDGHFDRSPLDGREALSWPEGGSPSLVDSDVDDLPYWREPPRRYRDPFKRTYRLPPYFPETDRSRLFIRGSLDNAELSYGGGDGFVEVKLMEGSSLEYEVSISWPEGFAPMEVETDEDDSLCNEFPRSVFRHIDLGFFDEEFGWGGRPLVRFPFVVEANS